MSERAITLAQRRSALRTHCAVQRGELATAVSEIQSRLGAVDRGIHMMRRYAAPPILVVGGIALLVILGPRRLVRWLGRGAVFLTAGRRVMRLLR
jgi:YqjK-like protein